VIDVWCQLQPIAELPGLSIDSLPWAADLFEVTPKATPPLSPAGTIAATETQATFVKDMP